MGGETRKRPGKDMSIREQIDEIVLSHGLLVMSYDKCVDAIMGLIPTWTKVEDRLPKHNGHVYIITTLEGGRELNDMGFYQPTTRDWTLLIRPNYSHRVTHWQPITPPEGL